VMAQFASKAYTDNKTGDIDTQYETQPYLTTGSYWRQSLIVDGITAILGQPIGIMSFSRFWLLIKVQNLETSDHCGHTQLVWCLKTMFCQYVLLSPLNLRFLKCCKDLFEWRGPSFHLFFTSHSLGGWLAKVTTYTTEYLKREGNFSLGSYNGN
jgi:hypothetical protein